MKVLQQKEIAKILNCSKTKVCTLVKRYKEDNSLKPYTPIVWDLFADWLGVPVELAYPDKNRVK